VSEQFASYRTNSDPGDESRAVRASRGQGVVVSGAVDAPSARIVALRQSRARAVRAWRRRKRQAVDEIHADVSGFEAMAARLAAVTADRDRLSRVATLARAWKAADDAYQAAGAGLTGPAYARAVEQPELRRDRAEMALLAAVVALDADRPDGGGGQ
jgi:hypothetical protein